MFLRNIGKHLLDKLMPQSRKLQYKPAVLLFAFINAYVQYKVIIFLNKFINCMEWVDVIQNLWSN
jgi:hypothetical protein